jgi:hypothetical protein
MLSKIVHLAAFVSIAASFVAADESPFTLCTDEGCQDCPVSLTSEGTVSDTLQETLQNQSLSLTPNSLL